MKLTDSRRITGPTLISDGPGAALELLVRVDERDARDGLIEAYQDCATRMLVALEFEKPHFFSRVYDAGVSLGFIAPFDALYTACAINEWALAAAAEFLGRACWPTLGTKIVNVKILSRAQTPLRIAQRIVTRRTVAFAAGKDGIA